MIISLFLPLVIVLGALVASVVVNTKEIQRPARDFFAAYASAMVIWALGIWLCLQLPTEITYTYGSWEFFIAQVLFIAAGSVMLLSYLFIDSYAKKSWKLSLAGKINLGLFLGFVLLVCLPNTVILDFSVHPENYINSQQGLGAAYFSLYILYGYGLSLWTLFKRIKTEENRILKVQFKIMLLAYFVSITSLMFTNWFLPVYLNMPQLNNTGPLFYFIEAACFFYAVTRYRFFDLKLTLYQVGLYTLNLSLYLLPLCLTLKLAITDVMQPDNAVLLGIMFLMALVTFWGTTLLALEGLLSLFFYKSHKNPTRVITDCLENFKESSEEGYSHLQRALGVENLSFLAFDAPENQLPANLKEYFSSQKDDPLIKEELKFKRSLSSSNSQALSDDLDSMMAAAILPVKNAKKELLGFLVLEQKIDKSLFSVQEIKAIQRLLANANIYISKERDYSKNLEKLKKRGLADKHFLDGLMHEIRHPLMMARNIAEVIDWAKLRPEDQAFLKDSQSSLSDLSHKLDRVTLGAQWQSGKMNLNPSWNSLEDLGDYLEASFEGADFFTFEIDEAVSQKLFRFDLSALKDACIEVLNNGFRFNKADLPELKLMVEAEASNLRFVFTDNGVGIPKKSWKNLFELLEVEDEVRNVNTSGVGVGLTIVRGVAEAHGGNVNIIKSSDSGTTIEIVIPLESR